MEEFETYLDQIMKYRKAGIPKPHNQAFYQEKNKQYNELGLENVPFVCIKIPTGGGKTIVATHMLNSIYEKFAQSSGFKNRVCHGMLLSSLFSRLVGMYIPGKYSLYFSQTLDFVNPSIINDTITVVGKVISKTESTKLITLKTTIKNSFCNLVEGNAKVLLSK